MSRQANGAAGGLRGRGFDRAVEASIELSVPRERAWEVLVDLPGYGGWNPLTVAIEGELAVGRSLDLHVSFDGRRPFVQRERVAAVAPPGELRWGVVMGAPWLLRAERVQRLDALGPDRCRYSTVDRMTGALVPMVFALYGAALDRGFRAMAEALAREVERRR